MPIYEFYCPDCHRLYSFLSRSINTTKRPTCPDCTRPDLERRASAFAISKGRTEADDDPLSALDPSRLEGAMESLLRDSQGLNEDDPRQAARLMRGLYEATGLDLGPGTEEALSRMEAGEDPDAIDQELGEAMEAELASPEKGTALKRFQRRHLPPTVDSKLHEL